MIVIVIGDAFEVHAFSEITPPPLSARLRLAGKDVIDMTPFTGLRVELR